MHILYTPSHFKIFYNLSWGCIITVTGKMLDTDIQRVCVCVLDQTVNLTEASCLELHLPSKTSSQIREEGRARTDLNVRSPLTNMTSPTKRLSH